MEEIHINKLIKHNDRWFKEILYLKEHNVMRGGKVDMEHLAAWRDYTGANHVLRDNGGFIMCEIVEDAVVVEEVMTGNTMDNHV